MICAEYVAGFFDGEGSILISVRGRNRQTYLKLVFSNTDEAVLVEIQERFGGKILKRHRGNPNHSSVFSLTVIGVEAYELLREVMPHLRIKKERAELAMKFWAFRESRKQVRIANSPLAGTEGLAFKQKMQELNRKGTVH